MPWLDHEGGVARGSEAPAGGTAASDVGETGRWAAELTAMVDATGPAGAGRAPAPEPEAAEEAAARLVGARTAPATARAGSKDETALVAQLRQVNAFLSDDEVEILAGAILAGEPVLIQYRSSSGSVTNRVISEVQYSLNLLDAWCHLRNDSRTFLASEVLSVDYP
jgi:predicted DNA-binding transcriptional regulator YafY